MEAHEPFCTVLGVKGFCNEIVERFRWWRAAWKQLQVSLWKDQAKEVFHLELLFFLGRNATALQAEVLREKLAHHLSNVSTWWSFLHALEKYWRVAEFQNLIQRAILESKVLMILPQGNVRAKQNLFCGLVKLNYFTRVCLTNRINWHLQLNWLTHSFLSV